MIENKKRVIRVKKQHRDTLFRLLFKIPNNFMYLLAKCSNGASMLAESDIKAFDLESAVAVRLRRNDVSFITKDNPTTGQRN